MTHAIERTSPKGKGNKFIGICIKCGEEGLDIGAATKECPMDDEISDQEALMSIINVEGYINEH